MKGDLPILLLYFYDLLTPTHDIHATNNEREREGGGGDNGSGQDTLQSGHLSIRTQTGIGYVRFWFGSY